jgi:hypothetical protein
MADSITNADDIIDSRAVEERIEELQDSLYPWRAKLCDWAGIDKEDEFQTHEEARDALAEWLTDHAEFYDTETHRADQINNAAAQVAALNDGETTEFGVIEGDSLTATIEAIEIDEDDAEELRTLIALRDQFEGYTDWQHGATLVRDSYFEDYARELAEDIGAINGNASWPNNCIDWERAARELQVDYTSAEFDGVTYWAR